MWPNGELEELADDGGADPIRGRGGPRAALPRPRYGVHTARDLAEVDLARPRADHPASQGRPRAPRRPIVVLRRDRASRGRASRARPEDLDPPDHGDPPSERADGSPSATSTARSANHVHSHVRAPASRKPYAGDGECASIRSRRRRRARPATERKPTASSCARVAHAGGRLGEARSIASSPRARSPGPPVPR